MLKLRLRIIGCLLAMAVCPLLGAAEPPLRLGVITSLTGMASSFDHFQNNGMRLAQEELKAQGTEVELIFEDSASLGNKAIAAFNKLITFDKADAIISDDFGFAVAPLIPLADRSKKLLIASSLPQERFCKGSKGYFFSVGTQFSSSAPAFDAFFNAHPEVKRAAAFVYDDPEWGETYMGIWRELAAKHGVQITDEFLNLEATPSFLSMVSRALAKKPELILLAHEPITFSKAVSQLGYKGPILAANNFLEALYAGQSADEILKQVFVVEAVVNDSFRKSYEARFNEPPILEAYTGYELVRVAVKALSISRSDPAAAMPTISYQGVSGPIDFTNGACSGNRAQWGLFRFEGRSLVQVR